MPGILSSAKLSSAEMSSAKLFNLINFLEKIDLQKRNTNLSAIAMSTLGKLISYGYGLFLRSVE
jgi:hypothetical protein